MNGEVCLAADKDVGEKPLTIRKEVESKDDGSVGGILKGDDAVCHMAFLNGFKDVLRVISLAMTSMVF